MTELHQRRWQLRMKWWQITHPCVLANGKKKKNLTSVHYLLVVCFMYLYPISSAPLHLNYYFPLSVPGHRARWAFPSPLQGQGSFPEHTGRRRVRARMRWTRIDFSTPQSLWSWSERWRRHGVKCYTQRCKIWQPHINVPFIIIYWQR